MSSLSAAAEAAIDALVRHEVEDKTLPSLSWALSGPEGLLGQGHVVNSGEAAKLDEHSLFRIGSVTKTFTAVAVMQQVEKGVIDLDAPVSTYLPGFAPRNPWADNPQGPFGTDVTMRKLMSHTAGITREPKSGHYLDDKRPPLAQTVAELAETELKVDPSIGEMQYSNAGIAVVGAVLEAVTGTDYSSYVTENIFRPLGMSESHSGIAPGVRDVLAPAKMWTIDGDEPAPVFDLGGSPAGNIFSSTVDMARYTTMLLRGGFTPEGETIITPASLRQMWQIVGRRPEGYAGGQKGYGLGFGVGTMDGWSSVGHGGAVYGYATQMTLLPEAGLSVLVFNTLDFANQISTRIANDLLRVVLAERKQGKAPPAPAKPPAIAPADLEALPGLYSSPSGEMTEVVRREDRLYLMGEGVPLQIRPVSGAGWVMDGRIYGAQADYAHLDLSFPAAGTLRWKGEDWAKVDAPKTEEVPETVAPHLGTYGPDFNLTYLTWANGGLKCLIEYFCTHDCEPAGQGLFRMHGLLYEAEVLELGATDEQGRKGIRVGPMFLERREDLS
ncbi:serine hydrolase domain-containing protein [Pseudoroseicyclus sp. H15]